MPRPVAGRALFYTRDSEGRGDCAPPQEVRWAIEKARALDLRFRGAPEEIERMMREGRSSSGDLFLDYGISGNIVERAGLEALRREAKRDQGVSHILIPRRDRLIRPDNSMDGLNLELSFRREGLTFVFRDHVLGPVGRNGQIGIQDLVVGLFEYEQSGKFRRELADKLLRAQVQLAEQGFSIGGSPPYGFERWLVRLDGFRVRKLVPREHVKMVGHHVIWWPSDQAKIDTIARIFILIETMKASQIANLLTDERIPPPGAEFDSTAYMWHRTTIRNIVRSPIYMAVREYGKRSEGDRLRFTPAGPRELTDEDYNEAGKPRTVINPPDQRIKRDLTFPPLVDRGQFEKLQGVLDARAGTQRGKKRERHKSENPLGCRIFDLNCGWPMYRLSRRGTYFYTCGLNVQTNSAVCSHNTVPGPATANFVLACIRQRAMETSTLQRLRARIREIAELEMGVDRRDSEREAATKELKKITRELQLVSNNLAFAESDEERLAIRAVFNSLQASKQRVEAKLAECSQSVDSTAQLDREVDLALAGLEQVRELAANTAESATATTELFRALDVKLYVHFETVTQGRRELNIQRGGVLTFGSTSPPLPLYEGPTDKGIIRKRMADGEQSSLLAGFAAECGCDNKDGLEGKSGNVQRGTRSCT